MYALTTPLRFVRGIGPVRAAQLVEHNLVSVLDLLLMVPLRYEDRSTYTTIAAAPQNELITFQATVSSVKENFAPRRYVRAKLTDASGSLTALWFNNKYVAKNLLVGETYSFSGKVNDRGSLTQPMYEKIAADGDTIHTGRLVPVYSSTLPLPPASLRRLVKHICDHLIDEDDELLQQAMVQKISLLSRKATFKAVHFPEETEATVVARERLALEEIIALIRHSGKLKDQWSAGTPARALHKKISDVVPNSIPFSLTNAQQRCTQELITDLQKKSPMNRILIGDVGSGKTIVAGLAARQLVLQGETVFLIAPTRILAQQHFDTLQKFFTDISIELVTSQTGKVVKKAGQDRDSSKTASLRIGTHVLFSHIETDHPAMIIYDEQHRFGVAQRSLSDKIKPSPHILTMTATPIPRTLLLTIFSHLAVSVIDELPANRVPTKTWLLTESKREGLYDWLQLQASELEQGTFQSLIVCPFIDPSNALSLENVASVADYFEKMKKRFGKKLRIELLHGRQTKIEQKNVTQRLFAKEIDILVTTPIVEVGLDLPQATVIVIESAERFGLASLHQLRGRVGRAGQQGYCALFTSKPPSSIVRTRLKAFSKTTNGQQLAELDLQQRGAGDLFGTQQHGFDRLRFANWTNVDLIHQAQLLSGTLSAGWESLVPIITNDYSILAN
ncbi:ATP-dependent DNA helicase RecG [Candidatus Woesebacteria bacterium]|nr:ATP-dependent DNA helicase RecG [Candidatus Woesebacteria bacterium]